MTVTAFAEAGSVSLIIVCACIVIVAVIAVIISVRKQRAYDAATLEALEEMRDSAADLAGAMKTPAEHEKDPAAGRPTRHDTSPDDEGK